MATLELDLHTHSPLVPTDYRGPAETTARTVVEAAVRAGLGLLAVTDHFSVRYVPRMQIAADRHELESGEKLAVLAGAEIKVRWDGDEAHLIALFPPDSYDERFEDLSAGLGIDQSSLPVSELPAVKVDAHPCEVARCVAGLGGLCHIGHADRYFGPYRLLDSELFDELAVDAAIVAVELVDPANRTEVQRRAPGVPIIASSDAHSPSEIGRRRTTLQLDECSFAGLARALGR
ncbi:MAG: PHP-associated domain-containing protein [Anaerosomatales bacterium]|nr:PHP-associated domain-containing protein [Anaerosomatales bacterium]MDT8433619.1 PHP-associated domain-containing protein [Anaerosomatales bacterium]